MDRSLAGPGAVMVIILALAALGTLAATTPGGDPVLGIAIVTFGYLAAISVSRASPHVTRRGRQTRERDRLAAVVESAAAIAGSLELDDLLAELATSARNAVGWSKAEVYAFDQDGGVDAKATAGLTEAEQSTLQVLVSSDVGTPPAERRMLLSKVPERQWFDEPGQLPGTVAALRATGKYQALLVPMLAHGDVLGTLVFWTPFDLQPFDLSDIQAASAIGHQAGLALHNSRLLSQARMNEDQMALKHRELEDRTQELEAKTREQDTFIYTVSHDLRSPLVSLQGLAGILLEDHAADLPGEARRYLDRIVANADKMQGLISDLLELSRVGRVEADQTPVDLGSVVADVVDQLGHTLAARGAVVRIAGDLPTVVANRAGMTQLFTNLIANAVAYTPADRTPLVRLDAEERPDCWEITIGDNGVGIPAAWQEKAFGLFQRLPAGKTLNPGGSGVGLAIVARIVETHRGRLWLESEEGVGSTFHVTLPKQAVSVAGDVTSADPAHAIELAGAAAD